MPAVDQMINNGSPYADHGRLIAHCTVLFYAALNPSSWIFYIVVGKKARNIIYLKRSHEDFANTMGVENVA